MQAAVSDSALDALVDTLGMPEPEPEEDLSAIVEVEEVLLHRKTRQKLFCLLPWGSPRSNIKSVGISI